MAEAIAEAVLQLATGADLAALNGDLESELAVLEQRMTIKLGGMMVVSVGIILALNSSTEPPAREGKSRKGVR